MFSKNNIFDSLILNNEKEVFSIKNNNENYNSGTLTCLGGASFHKGISVGMQDRMVNGLLIYDDENFFGYSEKNGLILLSINFDFKELEMPTLDNNSEKQEKILNIDLTFRDIINYYINIPNNIDKYDISLIFNIKFIYDDESLVNKINFHIINDNKKEIKYNILNNNIYYSSSKIKKNNNSIIKLSLNYVDQEHMLCNIDKFTK